MIGILKVQKMFKNFEHQLPAKMPRQWSSAGPGQSASSEAFYSGSSLSATLTSFLWILALIDNILTL